MPVSKSPMVRGWGTQSADAQAHEITKTAIAQGMVLADVIRYFDHYDMITATKWSRSRKSRIRAKAIAPSSIRRMRR